MIDFTRIEVIKGNIVTVDADIIVNAANEKLLGGGGVDGAIHRAAGPGLLEACRKIGGCPTGEARLTEAYNLDAEFIIHTAGPVWRGGHRNEHALLASCYRESLRLAAEKKSKNTAFPAISTGVYNFPPEEAANIAITEVIRFLKTNDFPEKVTFVLFDTLNYNLYTKILNDK